MKYLLLLTLAALCLYCGDENYPGVDTPCEVCALDAWLLNIGDTVYDTEEFTVLCDGRVITFNTRQCEGEVFGYIPFNITEYIVETLQECGYEVPPSCDI